MVAQIELNGQLSICEKSEEVGWDCPMGLCFYNSCEASTSYSLCTAPPRSSCVAMCRRLMSVSNAPKSGIPEPTSTPARGLADEGERERRGAARPRAPRARRAHHRPPRHQGGDPLLAPGLPARLARSADESHGSRYPLTAGGLPSVSPHRALLVAPDLLSSEPLISQ